MKRAVFIFVVASIAGCATEPPDKRYVMNVNNYDQARKDRDGYECNKDAVLMWPETAANQYTPGNRKETYLQCMKARGYEIRSD